MKKNTTIILVVAVAVVAFVGGYFMARSSAPAQSTQSGRRQFGAGFGANGQSALSGQVASMDSNSLTLELPQGNGSRVVVFGPSVQVRKTVSGSLSDVATGTNVMVIGATNSDGSLTAQSIQIRQPGDNAGFGGRFGAPSGGTSSGQ